MKILLILIVFAMALSNASGDDVKKVETTPPPAGNGTSAPQNKTEADADGMDNKTDTKWVTFPGYYFKSATFKLEKMDSEDLKNVTKQLDEIFERLHQLERIENYLRAHDALEPSPKKNEATANGLLNSGMFLIVLAGIIGASF